jgi:hypothetical protein
MKRDDTLIRTASTVTVTEHVMGFLVDPVMTSQLVRLTFCEWYDEPGYEHPVESVKSILKSII